MKANGLHHTLKREKDEEAAKDPDLDDSSDKHWEDQDEEGSSSSVKNMVEQNEDDSAKDKSEASDEDDRQPENAVEEVSRSDNADDDFDDQNLDELSRRPTSGMNPSRPKSFSLDDDSGSNQRFSGGQRLNSQMSSTGLYTKNRPHRSNGLKFVLLLIVALIVIGGSIFVLKGQASFHRLLSKFSSGETPAPTPMSEVTSEPTPSPTPAFDRSLFTIRVLNGTSKSGLAASVSAKLKSLGYNTDKTGNATNSAFTQTVVLVKDSDASLSAQLIQDLSPDLDATTSGVLKSSDTSDGEVILGAK